MKRTTLLGVILIVVIMVAIVEESEAWLIKGQGRRRKFSEKTKKVWNKAKPARKVVRGTFDLLDAIR